MTLKEWWEKLYDTVRLNDSGESIKFLGREPSSLLRRAIMEADNPFPLSLGEQLLNIIAQELLNRNVDRGERISNLFAIIVSRCTRTLREKALGELIVLDAKEQVEDSIMAVALQRLPSFCPWDPRYSSLLNK
ncbi:MAG: hypothetical protein AAB524_01170 [Patescibacteria group bacterium]